MQTLSAKRKWFIVIGLALGPSMANGFARFAYALLLPSMRADLNLSYTQAGWLNTANGIGYLLGALTALFLVAHLGAVRLFIWGFALTTLAMFGSSSSPDWVAQSLFRMMAGFGSAPVFVMGGVLTSVLFPGNRKLNAFAVALYLGGGGLGMLGTGIFLPSYLDIHFPYGWQMAWAFMAVSSSVMFLIVLWAALQVNNLPKEVGLKLVGLRIGAMVPALFAYFFFGLGYVIYMTFLISWLRVNGAGVNLTSAVWSLMGIAVVASPFVWRPVLSNAHAGRAIAWTSLALAIGALIPLAANSMSILVSAVIFGGSMFMVPTSVTNFAKQSISENLMGAAVALFTVVFSIGQVMGPIGAGLVLDISENSNWVLFLTTSILTFGVVAALAQPSLAKI